jgi:hypothetical protein
VSKRIGNVTIIAEEPPDFCAFCQRFEELRPYGPRGERICFACAMKDEASAKRQMERVLFGEDVQ